MTAANVHQQFDMARLLIGMARSLLDSKTTSLGIDEIRQLPIGVHGLRFQMLDEGDVRLIDFEAVCLVELMIALTFAREIEHEKRCEWIEPVMQQFVAVMEGDLAIAEKARMR